MPDYSSVNVLLLLAGTSSRCWPLRDKTLFPMCGKTVLEHQLERLKSVGLTNVTLVASDHNRDAAHDIAPELPILLQRNDAPGTHGALISTLGNFDDEPVLMICGTDIVHPNLYTEVIDRGQTENVDGVIVGQHLEEYFPGGYLCTKGERVTSLHEKPGKGNEPSSLVHVQIHYHHDASIVLQALEDTNQYAEGVSTPEGTADGFANTQELLYKEYNYHFVTYNGHWQAIKFPWYLLDAQDYFHEEMVKTNIHETAEIHTNAVIEGNVTIEAGVKILAGAIVRGPCTIGKNTVIGHGTLIRQSSIGKECVIGHGTEIARSIIGDHCWTHKNYIGDSILGHHVVMGAGSITTNLRLDAEEVTTVIKGQTLSSNRVKLGTVIGNNTRLGTHVTIEPGVKIGRDCIVQPKAHLTMDVPDNSIVGVQQGKIEVSKKNSTEKFTKPTNRRIILFSHDKHTTKFTIIGIFKRPHLLE